MRLARAGDAAMPTRLVSAAMMPSAQAIRRITDSLRPVAGEDATGESADLNMKPKSYQWPVFGVA
jgi:hypothetical protein